MSSVHDNNICALLITFLSAICNNTSNSHRMKHMAAYLMLVLGGNESPTADDVSKALSSVGVEADSEQLTTLISELEGKDLGEVLASGEALLAKFGSGGGGGGGGGGGAYSSSTTLFIFLSVCTHFYVSHFLTN